MHGAKMPRSDSFDFVDYQSSPGEARDDATIISRSQQPALEPFAPSRHTVRVELQHGERFPSLDITGPPPTYDGDGQDRPVFIGVAPFKGGLVPCKIVPDFMPNPVRLGHGGTEWTVDEPFYILPLDSSTMEWVHAADGKIPNGRRPVEGGFEDDGAPLYHAVALIDGVRVPGKTGEHLEDGAIVPYGGVEESRRHYQILCWRN